MTGQGRGFVGIDPKVYRIGKIVLTSLIRSNIILYYIHPSIHTAGGGEKGGHPISALEFKARKCFLGNNKIEGTGAWSWLYAMSRRIDVRTFAL